MNRPGAGPDSDTRGFGLNLTAPVQAPSPMLPGGFVFWIWRVRQAVDDGSGADALEAPPAAAKIWQPTAVRTLFARPEE